MTGRVRSLRARLFLWLAVAALAAAGLTAALALVLADRADDAQALTVLRRQADAIQTGLEATGAPARAQLRIFVPNGRGRLVQALGRPGAAPALRARARLLQDALAAHTDPEGTLRIEGVEFAYVRRSGSAGDLVVVRRTGEGGTSPVGAILLLAGLGAAVLAGGLALLATRGLTRPLAGLASAARRLAAGDRDARAPAGGPAEVVAVAGAFNAMADDLAAARDAEGRFLLAVAHELRTPLTAVRGHAEALADGVLTPAESGRVIQAETERLERLVADLTDLARLEARRFSIDLSPVELGPLAGEAAARHAEAARERGVVLEADGTAGATVLADHGRLLQVLGNLVDNALRVTPPHGRVTVVADGRRLVVRDTGPGLSAADRARAFERFHLHDRHGADGPGGTGVGLAIVRELVEAMGGRVAAEQAEGGGTAFVVEMPPAP